MKKYFSIDVLIVLVVFLLGINSMVSAQELPEATTDFRGLWISKFGSEILGDEEKEDELITYAVDYGFNLLSCTNMYSILPNDFDTTTDVVTQLRRFVAKAHSAGIEYVSGNVGSEGTAIKVQNYNNLGTTSADQKFDIISYECEFYNDNTNAPCSSFDSYISQLSSMRTICDNTEGSVSGSSLLLDVYIGGQGNSGAIVTNSSQSEMQQIAALADKISVTYYVSNPSKSNGNFFNNSIQRLEWISNVEDPTQLILLFKSRNTDSNNFYSYLSNFEGTHCDALVDPFRSWVEGSSYNSELVAGYIENFESGDMDWLAGIQVVGFNYFTYQANLEIANLVETASQTTLINESEFIIYPNPSSGVFEIRGLNDDEIDIVEVYNSLGSMIYRSNSTTIDLSDSNAGLYTVKVYSNNSYFTEKIIKE